MADQTVSVVPPVAPRLSEPVVSCRALTKRYGELAAVDDVTFSLERGTVTGYLGPNGAGKTTTLRLLLDLAEPKSGEALVFERRYRELEQPFRHVGAMLESNDFHPARSGRDHVSMLALAAELPLGRVEEVLELVESGVESDELLERLFELSVLLADGMDRGLAEQGLSRARAEVIWRLQRGGPATQRELSEALRCTPRNVTGLVDALEAAGLVARSPTPPTGARPSSASHSEARAPRRPGRASIKSSLPSLFGELPAADRTHLVTTLEHVLEKLHASSSPPPDKPLVS